MHHGKILEMLNRQLVRIIIMDILEIMREKGERIIHVY